ncbi:MAG: PcfJ domain-containing protein [Lachnospiraceae bacterium]|nr:PcfJ domain-containing protein [Lachnospiraceae bacterium]
MLEFGYVNTWEPEELTDDIVDKCIAECIHMAPDMSLGYQDFLIFLQIEPYIDTVYLHFPNFSRKPDVCIRFPFHEGHMWPYEHRRVFDTGCVNNANIMYSHETIRRIYALYSDKYPGWHMPAYHNEDMKILDHIYNCLQTNTVKEILYKANLDHLAAYSGYMDELNLLAGKPSDIYEGISMRTLKALNTHEGAILLSAHSYRKRVIKLQTSFPDMFSEKLNDAQCHYIRDLIDNRLTISEIGRLYMSARKRLFMVWHENQYKRFIYAETRGRKILEQIEAVNRIDPIYEKYLPKYSEGLVSDQFNYRQLFVYLLSERDKYDRAIRVSNRKRCYEWQERDDEYVIRYPQTVNDFCREAVYMRNCLSGYLDAIINNDTTILFMRRADDVNKPFITIEVYRNRLVQAYHRFNEDCENEEVFWIRAYCDRHGINHTGYRFAREYDLDDI